MAAAGTIMSGSAITVNPPFRTADRLTEVMDAALEREDTSRPQYGPVFWRRVHASVDTSRGSTSGNRPSGQGFRLPDLRWECCSMS